MGMAGVARTAGAVVLAFGLALVGRLSEPLPLPEPRTAAERAKRNLIVFDEVWSKLDQRHFDNASRRETWRAALKRYRPLARQAPDTAGLYFQVLTPMLNEMGQSHVAVSPPLGVDLWKHAQPEGSVSKPRLFIGPAKSTNGDALHALGIQLSGDEVIDLIKGGSAEQAGVEPGWRIGLIVPTASIGERRYTFLTSAGARQLTLGHGRSPPPRVSYAKQILPSGALLLRFDAFKQEQIDWVLAQLKSAPPQGVILDLRTNGGGRVIQEERLLSALLPDHSLIGVRVTNGRRQTLHTRAHGPLYHGPLAILISPRSASAAEVTARAIGHHGRGVLVGRRSAGSVLTSTDFKLRDGGRLQAPIHDYLDPSGRRIEGVGVEPHIRVAPTLATVRAGRDPVLEAAERALTSARR
ncbi:S41 family peptidase [Brevundimonas sp. CEF1]|uniref:S41 family peptidase n=1 Tax=Brevundimonas sp. CEF1 TaxID=3442642 RepID=UPI003F510575